MIRTVKLNNYLPKYIQQYNEIQEIMNTENSEFQIIDNQSEILKNNLFISSCDEKGISRFESIMKITPLDTDTLESRISRVLTRWNEKLPYTFKDLVNKLDRLCGKEKYVIIPDFNNYTLELIVNLPLSGQVEELDNFLSYTIPANIVVNSKNILNYNLFAKVILAIGNIKTNYFNISSKMNKEEVLTGIITNSSIVVKTIEKIIN